MTTNWTNAILEKCVVSLTKLQKPFKYIGKYVQTRHGQLYTLTVQLLRFFENHKALKFLKKIIAIPFEHF